MIRYNELSLMRFFTFTRRHLLEHEHFKVRSRRRRVLRRTAVTGERAAPVLVERHLVRVAGEQDGGGHRVQHAEDADADHELLELLRLGPALLLEHAPDARQAGETGEQEAAAEHQVTAEREEHEPAHQTRLLDADVADAGQRVAVDGGQEEGGGRLERRHRPRHQVEERRAAGDGLAAPLSSGGQEPSER